MLGSVHDQIPRASETKDINPPSRHAISLRKRVRSSGLLTRRGIRDKADLVRSEQRNAQQVATVGGWIGGYRCVQGVHVVVGVINDRVAAGDLCGRVSPRAR